MSYTPIVIGSLAWGTPVNNAFTSQDARITALENQVPSQGVTVPESWGQFWRPKRDAAGAASAKLMLIGDSVTHGFYSSNLKTTSWAGRVKTSLQTAYGDGGSGMFSTSSTQVNSAVSAGAQALWEGNGSYATTTGTWTTGIAFGPGISHIRSTNTATVTFPGIVGTNIRLWYITGGAPRAAWTYDIDGGGPVAVPAVVGATTIANIDVAVAAGTHSVVISWNGVAGDVLDFIGVAGYNATGIIVDNMGRSGTNASSAQWGNPSALTMPWNGGTSNPADLVIVAIGINDALLISEAPDVWVTGMANVLTQIKAANNGATDIILLHQHYGSSANNNLYTQYATRIHDLADNFGAAMVNMWAAGRNSWDYWNSLTFWGDSANPAVSGTNSVHPSDAGHQFIANTLLPILNS